MINFPTHTCVINQEPAIRESGSLARAVGKAVRHAIVIIGYSVEDG